MQQHMRPRLRNLSRTKRVARLLQCNNMSRISTKHICLPVRPCIFLIPFSLFFFLLFSFSSWLSFNLGFWFLEKKKSKNIKKKIHTNTRKGREEKKTKKHIRKEERFLFFWLRTKTEMGMCRLYYFRFIINFPVPFISFVRRIYSVRLCVIWASQHFDEGFFYLAVIFSRSLLYWFGFVSDFKSEKRSFEITWPCASLRLMDFKVL